MNLRKSLVFAVAVLTTANAFVPIKPNRPASGLSVAAEPSKEPEASDVVAESAIPASDPYERIGISKSELAIGIDASAFLQWIGTKEELKAKFQRDNKGMNEKRAEEEVSKFLMDSEMVNAYIEFEKDKVLNPPDLRAEAEQNLSDPKTIATYAAWLIGGAGFGFVRKEIIEPKYASGEWEEIHISLPSWIPQMKPASEKAAEAAESTIQSASEIVSSAMVGSDGAFHSIQEAIGTHLSNF